MAPDPGDDPAQSTTSLIDDVADYWTRALSGIADTVNGTYTFSDVFADVLECSTRASRLGTDLLRGVGLLPPEPTASRNPSEVTVHVPIDDAGVSTTAKLSCGDLRAIGFGEQYKIPAAMVQVGAPIDKDGVMTVPVTVSFTQVGRFERLRTIVYEGRIKTLSAPAWGGVVRVPKPAQ